MKPIFAAALALALAGSAGGCQCFGLTDAYADLIDHVADVEVQLDPLYHPCHDLTRIGHPDWCRCWFNRWWCRACRFVTLDRGRAGPHGTGCECD